LQIARHAFRFGCYSCMVLESLEACPVFLCSTMTGMLGAPPISWCIHSCWWCVMIGYRILPPHITLFDLHMACIPNRQRSALSRTGYPHSVPLFGRHHTPQVQVVPCHLPIYLHSIGNSGVVVAPADPPDPVPSIVPFGAVLSFGFPVACCYNPVHSWGRVRS
jgi:hypothetical protein